MKKIYFLGVGGVSMSALAIMLKHDGWIVGGSDEMESEGTKLLKNEGISVDFSLNQEKILSADEVCYSSAIKPCNRQFVFAKTHNKKMLTRGQILGKIAEQYEKVIAVAGSHGKTTTTAMIFQILGYYGKNPTLHLGGFRLEDGKNYHVGGKEFFVTEACEYYNNFLNLHPYIGVVTNIEREHLDFFKTFENQKKSFEQFKSQSQLVIDDIQTFHAENLYHDKNGHLCFSLFEGERCVMDLKLKICEEINAQNCIYAYQVAKVLGIGDEDIKRGLESFEGVERRFERVNSPFFDVVVCDYAHHPTEIEKAIISAKKIFKGRSLVTIFQPHTFSRTKILLDDFVNVFADVDEPLFFKTYSARESEKDGMTAEQFTETVKKVNKNAKYFENFDTLFDFLLTKQNEKVALLFVGAGDLPAILNKKHFIS